MVWAFKAQTKTKYVQNPNEIVKILDNWASNVLSHLGLMDVPFSNRNFCLKSERNRLDFGRCPNTKLSETGPKVERLRTKLVRILVFHFTVIVLVL